MYTSKSILNLQTNQSAEQTEAAIKKHDGWFYKYNFSNGISTNLDNELINTIHQTRADIIFPYLDEFFGGKWKGVKCLDIACNQGWFASQIAIRGASEVIGFDIRNEHLNKANEIKEIANLQNISYVNKNLFDIKDNEFGTFDLTLFLGLLYHLENPIGALRKVRSLTSKMCVIETQVTRTMPNSQILNGADTSLKTGSSIGVYTSDKNHVQDDLSIVIVPTLDALYQMLYAVGFDRIYLAVPPKAMYDQYSDFDRVILFAQVL
ncbi:hypothetical protein GCM10008014_42090 [Paenibacillus silvae]|uniref:Methyltransferase domain-containing protein n=1 Tax=Paenibacillus silvae TaxID=1325358 RepID=A0ABQ1ZFR0_9BACL|nr:class I SAM-dependent methyltransferase [Paenibacillus silvae]GGH64073.1 hypothetical protein GCM10008014_42090 [Paenibacillus silvae]